MSDTFTSLSKHDQKAADKAAKEQAKLDAKATADKAIADKAAEAKRIVENKIASDKAQANTEPPRQTASMFPMIIGVVGLLALFWFLRK